MKMDHVLFAHNGAKQYFNELVSGMEVNDIVISSAYIIILHYAE